VTIEPPRLSNRGILFFQGIAHGPCRIVANRDISAGLILQLPKKGSRYFAVSQAMFQIGLFGLQIGMVRHGRDKDW
jgi:hypothetical protein